MAKGSSVYAAEALTEEEVACEYGRTVAEPGRAESRVLVTRTTLHHWVMRLPMA